LKDFRLRFSLFWKMLLVLWLALVIAVLTGHLLVHQFGDVVAGIYPLNWSPGRPEPGETTAFYPFMFMAPGLVIMVLVSWWWARHVSAPLRQMATRLDAVAEGDASAELPDSVAGRRDEIGVLSLAVNTLVLRAGESRDRQRTLVRDLCEDLLIRLSRQRRGIEQVEQDLDQGQPLAAALRQNRRMELMIGQVATLCQLAEAGSDIARAPVDLVRLTHRVLQYTTDDAEQRAIDCRLKVSPQCRGMTVLGDAGLLQRALDNVLQNALDRTPPGQSVALTLTEQQGSDRQGPACPPGNGADQRGEIRYIRCDIKDTGPAVSAETLAILFEPFAPKTESGLVRELGLATAAHIMRNHDGEIRAEQVPGGGLVVSLVLPVFTESGRP
jgi:signal transduction histidine kinase